MMGDLSRTIRQRLIGEMVQIVSRHIGPEFDFVLILRESQSIPYVLTDVSTESAHEMMSDALNHPDAP